MTVKSRYAPHEMSQDALILASPIEPEDLVQVCALALISRSAIALISRSPLALPSLSSISLPLSPSPLSSHSPHSLSAHPSVRFLPKPPRRRQPPCVPPLGAGLPPEQVCSQHARKYSNPDPACLTEGLLSSPACDSPCDDLPVVHMHCSNPSAGSNR